MWGCILLIDFCITRKWQALNCFGHLFLEDNYSLMALWLSEFDFNRIAFWLQTYSFLQLVFLKNFKIEDLSEVLSIAPVLDVSIQYWNDILNSCLPSHEKILKNQTRFFFFTKYIFETTLYVLA